MYGAARRRTHYLYCRARGRDKGGRGVGGRGSQEEAADSVDARRRVKRTDRESGGGSIHPTEKGLVVRALLSLIACV